jgi:hypothetical protein
MPTVTATGRKSMANRATRNAALLLNAELNQISNLVSPLHQRLQQIEIGNAPEADKLFDAVSALSDARHALQRAMELTE